MLAGILLYPEELETAMTCGVSRVMARLGEHYAYFPCPFWSERRRPALPFRTALEKSLITKAHGLRARGASVTREGEAVVFRYARPTGRVLLERLTRMPAATAPVFLTAQDGFADSCLVWHGDGVARAITSPSGTASALCGCFLLVVPGPGPDAAGILEDGFCLTLSHESWNRLQQSFDTGETVSLPTSGLRFVSECLQETYHNPIDGLTYTAPGGWRFLKPAAKRGTGTVMFLSFFSDLNATIAASLAEYVDAIDDVLQRHVTLAEPCERPNFIVEVSLDDTGPASVRVAAKSPAPGELAAASAEVHALPTPTLRSGQVRFQVQFCVGPPPPAL
jgi:hypothetical protein